MCSIGFWGVVREYGTLPASNTKKICPIFFEFASHRENLRSAPTSDIFFHNCKSFKKAFCQTFKNKFNLEDIDTQSART